MSGGSTAMPALATGGGWPSAPVGPGDWRLRPIIGKTHRSGYINGSPAREYVEANVHEHRHMTSIWGMAAYRRVNVRGELIERPPLLLCGDDSYMTSEFSGLRSAHELHKSSVYDGWKVMVYPRGDPAGPIGAVCA